MTQQKHWIAGGVAAATIGPLLSSPSLRMWLRSALAVLPALQLCQSPGVRASSD